MSDKGFMAQIDKTLAFEGGYVNDPDDSGGETNFGISKRSYPNEDIGNMTRERAVSIYRRDYWLSPGFDQLPPLMGAKVFDLGVNMGQRTATRLLQRAINHELPTEAAPLVMDGRIGNLTIAAAFSIDDAAVTARLRLEAQNHYLSLIAGNPTFRKYQRGWLRRALA